MDIIFYIFSRRYVDLQFKVIIKKEKFRRHIVFRYIKIITINRTVNEEVNKKAKKPKKIHRRVSRNLQRRQSKLKGCKKKGKGTNGKEPQNVEANCVAGEVMTQRIFIAIGPSQFTKTTLNMKLYKYRL